METVWALVNDPNRYPEWASEVLEVTGLPTVETDAVFHQLTEDQGGTEVVNFRIEELNLRLAGDMLDGLSRTAGGG